MSLHRADYGLRTFSNTCEVGKYENYSNCIVARGKPLVPSSRQWFDRVVAAASKKDLTESSAFPTLSKCGDELAESASEENVCVSSASLKFSDTKRQTLASVVPSTKDRQRATKKDRAAKKKRKKMYSDYIGVTYNKTHAKFQACITHYRKQHYLGRYKLAVDAARAYDESAKQLKGKGWKINFSSEEGYKRARQEEAERYAYAEIQAGRVSHYSMSVD